MENQKKTSECCDARKIAHLQMIQGVIDRMAGNLFYLKGWAITLLAGLFTFSASGILNDEWSVLLFIILLLLFWILDGYFLSLERCFRDLYDKVRQLDERDIDFSMHIGEYIKLRSRSPLKTMFRPTLLGFYGIILTSMVLITLLNQ